MNRPLISSIEKLNSNRVFGYMVSVYCILVKATKIQSGLETSIQLEFKLTQFSRD